MRSLLSLSAVCSFAVALVVLSATPAEAGPLRVYVLTGQSNMQGHARTETLGYMADDPATKPLLAEIVGEDGQPKVIDRVFISYLTGSAEETADAIGPLTAGYGARRTSLQPDGKIGPELTFGSTIAKSTDGPVLIIKAAWGGKSLHTDFRPPSGGPFEISDEFKEQLTKRGKDVAEFEAEKAAATGLYYRATIEHVKRVLNDIKRVYPDYDPADGYELAGFVWFQGWNDMVDSSVYPNRNEPGGYQMYSDLMAAFIRDVRKDLDAPKMPFVIGVMGVGGPLEDYPENSRSRDVHANFRAAMAAPASLPEFEGNVAAVETAPFWDPTLESINRKKDDVRQMGYFLKSKHKDHANADGMMTPEQQRAWLDDYSTKLISTEEEEIWNRGASNAAYHYLGCGKTMALIGQAFANAIVEMGE